MDLFFSFIVPVYNRPDEIRELLQSLVAQDYEEAFEIVIVEDGSTISSEQVINEFKDVVSLSYFRKSNSGPGDSRNYGMKRARGDYFIILDSDCVLPSSYLSTVKKVLSKDFVDCYGGPDAAHSSFSKVQKAINYAMTAFLTTGGIRGNKRSVTEFQPRSFNMGISKNAFEGVGGFGNIHPGEDPDLSIRLWKQGFSTKLIAEVFVYHKRRIDWKKFYTQVRKFGAVRPILNQWHPNSAKVTYWFPAFFCIAFITSLMLWAFGLVLPILFFIVYFALVYFDSFVKNKSITIALLSLLAVNIQFWGYGYGFLKSSILLSVTRKKPEELFPELFFEATGTNT